MPDHPPQPPVATPAPPTPPANEPAARQWNMWCHLSALSGLVVPFGNVLGPLLIWQIKKDEFPSVVLHGQAALNFQLTVFLATLAAAAIVVVLCFFCIGFLLLPFVGAIPIAGLVFAIIAGVKANDGKEYRYPFSLTLVT